MCPDDGNESDETAGDGSFGSGMEQKEPSPLLHGMRRDKTSYIEDEKNRFLRIDKIKMEKV